jgi:hypothetical protein
MAYTSDRTGANIDLILDHADQSNGGLPTTAGLSQDFNSLEYNAAYYMNGSQPNAPAPTLNYFVENMVGSTTDLKVQIAYDLLGGAHIRRKLSGVWGAWDNMYNDSNVGAVLFNIETTVPLFGTDFVSFGETSGFIGIGNAGTSSATAIGFTNANGLVGSVSTSGTATAYNTSSDERLKDFKELPSDELVNSKFSDLYSCFRVFNWKNDPDGDLVWGFGAHACVDAGLDMGSEGEGPRDLEIGEVYHTEPAVTEQRVKLDEDGNPTNEIEEVVVKEAVEHRVTPAGVDQSKAVPILLAKIEQMERRLKALEG